MLHHLFINLVPNITLVHHNDVLHTIYIMLIFVMIADLGNQFEQQCRAFFIVNLRLYTQLLQNNLFGIKSIKVNGISLDTHSVLHILQILNQQFIADRHMGEIYHIQIKIYEYIFLNTGIRNFNAWNRNKLCLCRTMCFLCFMQNPRRQRHLVLTEHITQILVSAELLLSNFRNLPCLFRGHSMLRCILNIACNFCVDDFGCGFYERISCL